MKLDTENDRKLLLEIIAACDIKGAVAPMVADLIYRVQSAEIETKASPPDAAP